MVVYTDSPKATANQKQVMELLLINHPVDCPVCDQAGECSLQDFYMKFGRYHGRVDRSRKQHFKKHYDLGRNVMLDQERCVLCKRCVRFTEKITGTGELGVVHRADRSVIETMPGRKLESGYAMNVVDLCPVGALTSKDFRFHQRVWFLTPSPSVCHGCARGCNIYIHHANPKWEDDTIYRFRPRKNPAVNGHFICDDGRLSYKALQKNRLREPKRGAESLSIEAALALFKAWLEEAESVAILADGGLWLEELEMLKLFARERGASLHVPLEPYVDEAFADDWLKCAMRAANAEGVARLGLESPLPKNPVDLLICIDHPWGDRVAAKRRVDLTIHDSGTADLSLPRAAWSESAGTLVNIDGIEQRCERAVHPDRPLPDLLEWFEALDLLEKAGS
jgi:NADH-quinone oxidoreductase subunit G